MELPFKKGDIVRFEDNATGFQWLEKDKISKHFFLTVESCYEDTGTWSNFVVRLVEDEDSREWDSTWFVLDKNSIVRSILEDL